MKIRDQATATEDAIFPAYGAQTVHMPFGSVYTSLQTGVMDAAENSTNVYLVNKHYEVAPVLSMIEHEANNALVFVSDKLWQSLSADQKQWVNTAAAEISAKEPAKAFELEKAAATKLKGFGVKIVEDVDKKSFATLSDPLLDKLAKELGRPWLWLQEVTSTLFIYAIFIGAAVATRRNDHLYLTAISEALHGTPRLIVEIIIRIAVLGVAFCLIWFGYINYLRGFGSFRLPSGTPIASLYAAIPLSGVLIALFTIEQLVNGISKGFDHPEPPEEDFVIPPVDTGVQKRVRP